MTSRVHNIHTVVFQAHNVTKAWLSIHERDQVGLLLSLKFVAL